MDYKDLFSKALDDLYVAVSEMIKPTTPKTPLPRARQFCFFPGVFWPGKPETYDLLRFGVAYYWLTSVIDRQRMVNALVGYTEGKPRRVLRVYSAIRAATAWCKARAEGRRRHAAEILRQQAKAARILEAEATMLVLEKGMSDG